jgi:hypothetical protein
VQVRLRICRSGVPTLDGSNYSSLKETDSSTGLTRRFLMSEIAKTKRVKLLVSRIEMTPKCQMNRLLASKESVNNIEVESVSLWKEKLARDGFLNSHTNTVGQMRNIQRRD